MTVKRVASFMIDRLLIFIACFFAVEAVVFAYHFGPVLFAQVTTGYTAPELIAILAAVGGLVITVATQIGNLILAWRTSQKIDQNTAITTEVNKTTAVIEGHVNSQTTKLETETNALRSENAVLKQMLADTKTTAAVLASTAAQGSQASDVREQLQTIAADVAETKAQVTKAPRPPDARERASDREPQP